MFLGLRRKLSLLLFNGGLSYPFPYRFPFFLTVSLSFVLILSLLPVTVSVYIGLWLVGSLVLVVIWVFLVSFLSFSVFGLSYTVVCHVRSLFYVFVRPKRFHLSSMYNSRVTFFSSYLILLS